MIEREPDFSRVRKMLLLEGEPDAVPAVEIVVNDPIKDAFLCRKINGVQDDIQFWLKAGYDYYSYVPPYEPKLNLTTIPQDGRNWAVEGEGPIQTLADFDNHPWPTIDDVDFSSMDEANRSLPPGMKIIARAGEIFVYSWQFMGFEKFCYALADNPELPARLLDRIGHFIYSICEREVEYENVGALWYSDDIAYTEGLMVPPSFLRKHLFPWIKKAGDLARKRNIPLLYHTDGQLWEVLDDLAECGVNGLHPIEPKAMEAVELKRKYGHKFCLVGNIDLDLLVRRDTDFIREMVRKRLADLAPGGGYCAGSSNTIPEWVPLDHYVALQQAIMEFGRYPIRA